MTRKPRKPYPGMGAYVVVLRYSDAHGDEWVAHAGAATEERARAIRRTLSNWPSDRVRIVANVPE